MTWIKRRRTSLGTRWIALACQCLLLIIEWFGEGLLVHQHLNGSELPIIIDLLNSGGSVATCMVAEPTMLQGPEEVMYSGPPSSRFETSGSHVTRNKDGAPISSGNQASFEEYVEACLIYEQTVVKEKRYLCGPRCASELRGAAKRILVGQPATWLSHDQGVRALIAALRAERGYPKIPEMSELLMRYFKGSRRQRGESMHDFIMKKAEAYTRAQQSMARLQQETSGQSRSHDIQRSMGDAVSNSGRSERPMCEHSAAAGQDHGEDEEDMVTPRETAGDNDSGDRRSWDWQGRVWSYERGWHQTAMTAPSSSHWTDTSEWGRKDLPEILPD